MSRDPDPLQQLANSVWGALSADDAAMLHRLANQVGRQEMATRLGALAHRVATGSIEPPSAAAWLERQRPRHGGDP